MKKKTTTNGKPKNEWYFVDRLYRWLPIFLLLFSFANVYFVIKYVNEEKGDFEAIRDRALLNASNSYVFVERTLSNEIQRVRLAMSNEVLRVKFSNDMRLRPLFSPATNEQYKTDGVFPSDNPIMRDRKSVPARYFRMGGHPYLEIAGSYYSLGSDFGYGVIDKITPLGVICDGLFYPLEQKQEIVKNGIP